jgi:hypothetical protein
MKICAGIEPWSLESGNLIHMLTNEATFLEEMNFVLKI